MLERATVLTNKIPGDTIRKLKAWMYLAHKAAGNGAVGDAVATNPMREDDQRELSFTLSNRSVLQHTRVLND